MSSYNHAALLVDILNHLESANVTLTDLLCFALLARDPNNISRPIYQDLLQNTKTILSAFYYNPGTSSSTLAWAHATMCAQYAKAVSDLTHLDQQWHFVASQASPDQILDFRLEEMAETMEARAPILWTLIGSLLGDLQGRGRACNGYSGTLQGHGSWSALGSDSDSGSDSEDDYWDDSEMDKSREDMGEEAMASRRLAGRRRRVSPAVVHRIRTVVIMCILVQTCDQKSNALQSIVGIFLHACNTPEKVIKVLSRMGISISLTSIHRAIRSLSEQANEDIESLGQSRLASFGYDNFELQLATCIPTVDKPAEGLLHLTSGVLIRLAHGVTVDDLRCSRLLWERSSLNLHASDPRPFDAYKTMELLYTLHPETTHTQGSLSRRGRFRLWALQKILLEHGPTCLKDSYGTLEAPESIDAIPLVKTQYVPLRTMDLNQSKVSDNIAAILDMFKQAGIEDRSSGSGVDHPDVVTLVHGDLGTYERVQSAQRRRSVEDTPYDRLQSVVFVIGLFHLKMAAADAIWRLLVAPDNARVDEASFMRLIGRLRPQESSRLVANAKFRQQHELINHVLTVLVLDAWRAEIKKRKKASLEEWAKKEPSSAEIEDIAKTLVMDYVEGAGIDMYELEGRPRKERDQVRENVMRTMHYLLLYEELCYSLNAGDIGRFETILPHWIAIFRATGKHKYGIHTLRFIHALYFVYPERLRLVCYFRKQLLRGLTNSKKRHQPRHSV
ncbi:hypothetical protein GY45DRAFT_1396349 [Cubamyces sp. BRFM 1775]|nr:hypothetical protein GY45DRAFT_1396349 [Cubamyces sp. BRFM 1775]